MEKSRHEIKRELLQIIRDSSADNQLTFLVSQWFDKNVELLKTARISWNRDVVNGKTTINDALSAERAAERRAEDFYGGFDR